MPTSPSRATESHLEFVKAKDTGFLREIPSHHGYRITPAATHCDFCGVDSFVDINHECMEVDSAFTCYGRREGVVKQIHEHRLPSPDVSIQV